jgi:2-iminoacetate synthase ThiH
LATIAASAQDAEVLAKRVNREISPLKNIAATWIEIMDEAHCRSLSTNGTVMIGHVAAMRAPVAHLLALRDPQDRAHATPGP